MNKLQVCLSYLPPYHIDLPDELILYDAHNRKIDSRSPGYPENSSRHVFLTFNVPPGAGENLFLTIIKGEDSHAFAIDEIEGW